MTWALKASLGGVVALLLAVSAQAQAPQTVRIRGQIEKMDGALMTIKARDGSTLAV